MIAADQPHRVVDDGEISQTQEIELDEANPLNGFHRVLGDHFTILSPVQRHVFDNRSVADDHAGGMGRGMAREPLQHQGDFEQFLDLRIFPLQFGQTRFLFVSLLQRHSERGRDQLGDAIHFVVGHGQGPPHVANHRLGLHGAESDDLRNVILAVFFGHVAQHLLAAVDAKVHIDIRHAGAFVVQESFEDQPMFEWDPGR